MLNQENAPMTTEGIQVRDVVVNQVYRTKNYERFTSLEGNRDLNLFHYERLKKSIKEIDLSEANPILVNENFQIIDGQHRYAVCKELNKPIYYILVKGYGLKEVQILNMNMKNWRMEDYIEGYCKMGKTEYLYLSSFLKQHKLGVTNSLTILCSWGSETGNNLMNGSLVLTNKERGVVVSDWLNQLKPFYSGTARRSFITAMVKCYSIQKFDFNILIQKLAYQQTKMIDCVDTKNYLILLEEIYNYRSKGEKLRFF